MKSRDVVGKRIKSVHHRVVGRKESNTNSSFTIVSHIVLDDGTIISPYALETEYEPVGTMHAIKPKKGKVK